MFFVKRYPAAVLVPQIQVRSFNADKTCNLCSPNPKDRDQLNISIFSNVIAKIQEVKDMFLPEQVEV
ncbi:hypothetical protein FF38_01571 [Lucilia cuprina]|uniref:Uncharacterized protein n=1 Tax=Lucilia cuprina TaxID=7375 RepID=A0A0L0CH87_LUCCU|nr:hypothetical protein FF38_01571 [Lucilia cuprina]